jgi:hypothetical protein
MLMTSIYEKNINVVKKDIETLLDAIKEVDLELNAEKAKSMSSDQNAGQNRNINPSKLQQCYNMCERQ